MIADMESPFGKRNLACLYDFKAVISVSQQICLTENMRKTKERQIVLTECYRFFPAMSPVR